MVHFRSFEIFICPRFLLAWARFWRSPGSEPDCTRGAPLEPVEFERRQVGWRKPHGIAPRAGLPRVASLPAGKSDFWGVGVAAGAGGASNGLQRGCVAGLSGQAGVGVAAGAGGAWTPFSVASRGICRGPRERAKTGYRWGFVGRFFIVSSISCISPKNSYGHAPFDRQTAVSRLKNRKADTNSRTCGVWSKRRCHAGRLQ